ncbi:ARM REPEAT PROTEIN INTERACTING WITH ABF2-like isoform X2 [Camellia sinensis]|uniref:ARM REPEAT PROTEIN INTERACTING WITH ABF2-like isoform X2 n=1 Tax=Camellia sinensis TaxID=4442 RepID=UPI001036721E|nr:ARM REPEAT PROTEIN INTERACTING WITH ABF2-like isoform X2 [Camellia sinensis]
MLQSPNVQLREMSAFALAKTLKRLEEKIQGRVLSHLLYLMRIAKKTIQRRIALALANLCSAEDQRTIFIDNNGMPFSRLTFDIIEIVVPIDFNCLYHLCGGLELLLGFLGSTNLKQQLDGSIALYKLANKATTLSPIDMAPPSLTPQVCVLFIVSLFGPCVLLDLELFQTISRTSIW